MCLPQMLRKAFEGKSVSLVGSTEDQMRSFKDFRSRNAPNSPSATLNGGFVWRNPSRSKRTSTDSSRNSSSAAVQRQPKKNITIGFFLHTPFPSSEVFRCVVGTPLLHAPRTSRLTFKSSGHCRFEKKFCSASSTAT